jgi:hypothetical protein
MKRPPNVIQILLPVWGERYTKAFLEFCLPSLLAPRNIPALATLCPCTFVVLAPARDAQIIQKSALWSVLQRHSSVSIVPIDDLISRSSSTVLTLAYALAIRMAGARALETCFIPIVADYIFAEGTLSAVVERIIKGARAVLVGNFLISRESALADLEKAKDTGGILTIAARDLVALSLRSLHRATRDDVVSEDQRARANANRLFWQAGDNWMIGRFYLLHMIALHPETTDFVIGAPSDYSLVPELCPSGDVVRLTDSDEYFVVECQPNAIDTVEVNRVPAVSFARQLADWATAMHHDNARYPLIFHSGELPAGVVDAMALSERFVRQVEAVSVMPMPFRDHPQWARSLDYHIATAWIEQDTDRLSDITGDGTLMQHVRRAGFLRSMLLGRAPYFRPWHPRWKDTVVLKRELADAKGRIAVVANFPARVRLWFDEVTKRNDTVSITYVLPEHFIGWKEGSLSKAEFDFVICCLERAPADPGWLISNLGTLLRPGGVIVLAMGDALAEIEGTGSPVLPGSGLFTPPEGLSEDRAIGVGAGAWGDVVQGAMMRAARASVQAGTLGAVYWLVLAAGLAAASVVFNIAAITRREPVGEGKFSSLLYKFRKAGVVSGENAQVGYVVESAARHAHEIVEIRP